MLLWDFEVPYWSRALLVFSLTHLGVEGFVIYGWDMSNLGHSPYMTNLGDKTYMGTIPTSDGVCQIWVGFVEYGLLFTTVL